MRIFKETQRFNQWWLHLVSTGLIAFLLYCFYNWFIAKEATGNVSPNNVTGQIVVTVSIIPVVLFMYILKLKTWIDEIGVHYQFFPFHFSKKTVRWNELKKCYVRTYSPIKEYGGWGYRISTGQQGKAFNVRGKQGIQLVLKTGKKLLIGTQKEDDAKEVIQRCFKESDE